MYVHYLNFWYIWGQYLLMVTFKNVPLDLISEAPIATDGTSTVDPGT